jgi:ABC-type branched-subunit amino acid transport system permease subunit
MLLLAVGATCLSFRIRRSKFGLGLRAISQDEIKAEVAGIPTRFYKTLAFALSGLFIGMAGALWGYYLTYLSPAIFLSILVGAKFVLMKFWAAGNRVRPVIGAIVFIIVNEFFVASSGRPSSTSSRPACCWCSSSCSSRKDRRLTEKGRPLAEDARLGLRRWPRPRNSRSVSINNSGAWKCGA